MGNKKKGKKKGAPTSIKGMLAAKNMKELPLIVKGGLVITGLVAATKMSSVGDPVSQLQNKQWANFAKSASSNLRDLSTYYPLLGGVTAIVISKKV